MSMEKYRIAICDDDREFADYMGKLLQEICGGRAEIDKYGSGEELAEALGREHQLIVMDIGLEGMSGFEASKLLREENPDAVLVFCSGEYDPLPEFFETAAFRYLKKEYTEEKLKEDLTAAYKRVEELYGPQFLTARDTEGGYRMIPVKDIVYISKAKRGSELHIAGNRPLESGGCICKKHLRDIYEELRDWGFGWPHDSYIVNFHYIVRHTSEELDLETGEKLNISRARYKKFMDEMARYWGRKYS